MGTEEITREQDAVLGQVGDHGLGPVHPGGVHEAEGLAAQCQGFAVGDDPEPLAGNSQVIRQHGRRLGGTQQGGLGVFGQHPGDGARVILLGVLRDDVIDPVDAGQLALQHAGHGRIHRVQQRRLLGALHEVGVVAGAVRQRDQRIEQPAVPVHRAHPQHAVTDSSRFHAPDLQGFPAIRRARDECLPSIGWDPTPRHPTG